MSKVPPLPYGAPIKSPFISHGLGTHEFERTHGMTGPVSFTSQNWSSPGTTVAPTSNSVNRNTSCTPCGAVPQFVASLTGATSKADGVAPAAEPLAFTIPCTPCSTFRPTKLEVEFLFDTIDAFCGCTGSTEGPSVPCGNTSSICQIYSLIRDPIQKFVQNAYCFVANFVCNSPGKCLIDFLTGATGGICAGSLDPAGRECALKVFLQQSGLPPFPTSFVQDTIGNAILGFSARSIAYTYLPILIIGLLMIWIMVGVGWIGVGAGIIFSIGLFVIMYFFFVSYRSSFEVYVSNNIDNISTEVEKYKAAVSAAIPNIPAAAASALCAYTGNCFQCNPGIPACAGCTGATSASDNSSNLIESVPSPGTTGGLTNDFPRPCTTCPVKGFGN